MVTSLKLFRHWVSFSRSHFETIDRLYDLSYKFCIQSVVAVGPPLVICSETLEGRSVVSMRSHVSCRSTQSRKWLIGHIFFSTPMKRHNASYSGPQASYLSRQFRGYISLSTRKQLGVSETTRCHLQQLESKNLLTKGKMFPGTLCSVSLPCKSPSLFPFT